ncbi:MAG: hypothetical protein EHM72_14265 [Calditrichaeota bacterium]|nr:MAG: hypothetical protein EHM72_14265 [Calditrichota bacterium]
MKDYLKVLGIVLALLMMQEAAQAQQFPQQVALRVLDINVWSGLDYKGNLKMGEYEIASVREKRFKALVEQIKELKPDIIGIHEANKLPNFVLRLGDEIGFQVFYHVGLGGIRLGALGLPSNLREGDAILVQRHLYAEFIGRKQLSGGYVGNWASFHFSDATQILAIKIVLNNMPLFVFATHWHASLTGSPEIMAKASELLQNNETNETEFQNLLADIENGRQWRLSESEKTIDFIRRKAGDHPFILMGDFNAESNSQEISRLIQYGMVDTYSFFNQDTLGYTWDPNENLNQKIYYLEDQFPPCGIRLIDKMERYSKFISKRIDYIFIGPALLISSNLVSVQSSQVVMKKIIDGVHASDHFGIFTVLNISNLR